jgi:glycosyltransferase involved in cell wall biosynthesis
MNKALPTSIGILIVAYNAEATLEEVLMRIPASFVPRISALLICDDASNDETFSMAYRFKKLDLISQLK